MVRVKVTEGELEGSKVINKICGGIFYSFKGIAYAEPPVGELRFQAPLPPKPWLGVHSATDHGPICYQYDLYVTKETKGSEDCLYLNVYTPELNPDKPLPVMVWIHGGGFISGSGNDDFYGPELLVSRGVILVTINYRLDILGFLCLHTKEVPGNAGMKDQVAALRWVKKNIRPFGGDPDNVTIFGESVGGACVSYHCMSSMSKGLFNRAIIQSGQATSWYPNTHFARERGFALAKTLGCDSEDERDVYQFLIHQPVENLINKQIQLTFLESAKLCPTASFGVVVEKEFDNVERFLDGDVYDVLRRGLHEGIEIMNGYTEDDGVIFFAGGCDLDTIYNQANTFLEFFVPKPIEINCPLTEQLEVGRRVKKHYFKNQRVCRDTLDQLIRYINAESFIYPSILLQRTAAKMNKNKLYLYKFTCKSERNLFAKLVGISDMFDGETRVCHVDDLFYLFPFAILGQNIELNSKSYAMIQNITTLWTNFAKFGDPTPDDTLGAKWLPYTIQEENYMDIGEELTTGVAPDSEDIEFWNNIFRTFYPHIAI